MNLIPLLIFVGGYFLLFVLALFCFYCLLANNPREDEPDEATYYPPR